MVIEFTKMHGLGNDFIVIEDLDESLDLAPGAIEWMCDRNFGIGADGLILVRPASVSDATFFMLYYNADGTTAEMCGNGIRCFAKYVVDRRLVEPDVASIHVQTLGGVKPVTFARDDAARMTEATVDMGVPITDPPQVPISLPGIEVIDHEIEVGAGPLRFTAVSMGNPHAVTWVDDVEVAPVDSVGPLLESHRLFPSRTNVEFAQALSRSRVRVRVWERGVGETLACGTGACAVVVAGVLTDRLERCVTVELPGGDLVIAWERDGRVLMTGPASEVFRGTLAVPEDEALDV